MKKTHGMTWNIMYFVFIISVFLVLSISKSVSAHRCVISALNPFPDPVKVEQAGSIIRATFEDDNGFIAFTIFLLPEDGEECTVTSWISSSDVSASKGNELIIDREFGENHPAELFNEYVVSLNGFGVYLIDLHWGADPWDAEECNAAGEVCEFIFIVNPPDCESGNDGGNRQADVVGKFEAGECIDINVDIDGIDDDGNDNVVGKSFTFNCEHSMERMFFFGLEKLTMNVGDAENCTLKLTNHEPGKTVNVATKLRKLFGSAIEIEPAEGVTDENGELEITITAIEKGINWAAWAVPNDRGKFKFNKKTYDTGLAWGMFVDVE
ncbi:MAG: hypothetical protein ACUZ8O_07105 [Candidatus Anammoxibacter sp.]